MADHVLIDRAVVQQALDALCLWSAGHELDAVNLNNLIDRLEAALEQQAEPVQAVATFDEVWAAIDWDKWRLQPIRELVRMIHSKTSPAAPVQQAEPDHETRAELAEQQAEPVQRKPLTDEEMLDLISAEGGNNLRIPLASAINLIRATERAHGIKGGGNG